MIIQCPACNTSFSVSKDKFGSKNRKVKCSKCYFVWTVNPLGKAIEVPPLYESIKSQGGIIKENKEEPLDPNIKPDHPLPVPVKDNTNEKGGILSVTLILTFFLSLSMLWYNRIFLLENFPLIRPVLELIDPSINIRGIDNFEVMEISFSAILKATFSPSIAHGPAINRNLSLGILSLIIFIFF